MVLARVVSIDTFKIPFSLSSFSLSTHLSVLVLEPPGSSFLPLPAVCTLAGCKRQAQSREVGDRDRQGLHLCWVGAVVREERERWEREQATHFKIVYLQLTSSDTNDARCHSLYHS